MANTTTTAKSTVNTTTIGTHSGPFHADDVLACAILRKLQPSARIVRTRDPRVLAECDIVVDVGALHDPAAGRFDHHQKGAAGSRPNGVLYSAAGLVWAAYGAAYCDGDAALAERIDAEYISAICALDNGQGSTLLHGDVMHVTWSGNIAALNPTWQEDATPEAFDRAFANAVVRAGEDLDRWVASERATLACKGALASAIAEAVDPRIIVLDRFMPVMGDLPSASAEALYLVFPQAGDWLVQCVPDMVGDPSGFTPRKRFPAAWAGMRGDALPAASGVPDAVFCHNGRFIGGAASRKGALALAHLAADMAE